MRTGEITPRVDYSQLENNHLLKVRIGARDVVMAMGTWSALGRSAGLCAMQAVTMTFSSGGHDSGNGRR